MGREKADRRATRPAWVRDADTQRNASKKRPGPPLRHRGAGGLTKSGDTANRAIEATVTSWTRSWAAQGRDLGKTMMFRHFSKRLLFVSIRRNIALRSNE